MGFARSTRNLVFTRVGKTSLHRHWLGEAKNTRNWMLQLSTYDDTIVDLEDGDLALHFDKGTKWDSICRYMRANPQVLDEFDYIMFPDDDLMFEPNGISMAFDLVNTYTLDIAQPSLLPSSHISYPVTAHVPGYRLRYSNYVEPMCPIIRTAYLRSLLPSMERWPTGWGQDDIWTLLMPHPAYRAAFLDAAPILHTRPLHTGAVYKTFEKLGMDPQRDLEEIRSSYADVPQSKLIYGGVTSGGRRTGRVETNARNGLHLLRIATAMRSGSDAIRVGSGMLLRIVTRLHYQPTQIKTVARADHTTIDLLTT